jgi:hypothetical protein
LLAVIPFEGYDLVEITRADVNKSFGHVTIVATSDEPNAMLTAFTAGQELGMLTQKGDRYVGRFDLNGQQNNNVRVESSLGGCAQRAVPSETARPSAEKVLSGVRNAAPRRHQRAVYSSLRTAGKLDP